MAATDKVEVERLGGFGGFGQPGSHLRSRGTLTGAQLSATDQHALDGLFAGPPKARSAPMPDGFHYRLTRHVAGVAQVVEVAEDQVPAALRDSVKDELV